MMHLREHDDASLQLADVRRRLAAIFVGSIGNLVEWYDFYAYAAFALYFASAFFPGSDPVVQQLNAAILFAFGFIVGPSPVFERLFSLGRNAITNSPPHPKHRRFSIVP
jgi:hypothetical protein